MNKRCMLWMSSLFIMVVPLATRGEIVLHFAPERASLFVHEPFVLQLDVETEARPEMPELPTVSGLAFATIRRLPEDTARPLHRFQIGVVAERDGTLTIPPLAVRAGGEVAWTSSLPLHIRAPRPAKEMGLEVAVEPTDLRVGQPATVTVTWTSDVPLNRCKQVLFQIPLLVEETCQLFPIEPTGPDDERIGLPVNHLRVGARVGSLPDGRHVLTLRYKLIPCTPARLRTAPARLLCALVKEEDSSGQLPSYFYNHFFTVPEKDESFERVRLSAPVPEVSIRALPESGRTARFAEIVGPCDLETSVAPTNLLVGQPALFTVRLSGLTFARHIDALPSAAWDGLRPDFRISVEPIRETETDDARSFTCVVRPLRSGIKRIPALVIQTYDPDSNQYRILRSAPIPVTVKSDPEKGIGAGVPRVHSEPPIPTAGVRHNRLNELIMTIWRDTLEFLGSYGWLFVPLAPLVWFALLPVIRRRERCRRDAVFARAVAAWRRFRQAAGHDEELAWRKYLADRLALCADALTADTVTRSLYDRKVDDALIAETRRRFEQRDAADYGKRDTVPSGSTHDLVRRLQKATIPLLLLFLLCALSHAPRAEAADRAEELFATALEMREETPDEAQAKFTEAALSFESQRQYLNAANGWFFAGENGRALANYRAAERRSPFDRQVRESIAFLRANRADAFPAPTNPTGMVRAAWKRFCLWATVLRIGLFVLLYLVVWAVFLVSQLMGWRVRRIAWSALILVTLVPLVSVVQTSFQPGEGVVIEDTMARLGPGYAYDPAFEQPLHQGAEFSWIETRGDWIRIRLPDTSEGWLRSSDCLKVQ